MPVETRKEETFCSGLDSSAAVRLSSGKEHMVPAAFTCRLQGD
jgi:hypothetical protein